jgi:hypothetical protein
LEYFFYIKAILINLKNKAMKKLIACVAFVLAVSAVSTVSAQQGQGDPSARMAAMKQKMKDDLKLTDVQADSVSAINQEFRPQMRTIMMDQTLSQDDKKAKMQPINDAADKRIQAVLGDDLFKKYKDWRTANRPQRGGGGNGGGGNN